MEAIKSISQRLIIAVSLIFTACVSEEGPFITEIDTIDVSYSADIQHIFNNNCVVCHNQSHQTGLDLRENLSYDLLVNVTSTNYAPNLRITPFSLENSVLWHKIIDDGVFGGIMPASGGPLSNFEIEKIESWIELGALNN